MRPSRLSARSGSGQLRVRHHGATARVECQPELFGEILARRHEVVEAVRAAGFTFVALDLEGFRSGSLNRVLDGERGVVSQVRVKLTFPESEVRRPVLATMVRRFNVDPDIRRADLEEHRGWIVCLIDGEAEQIDAALEWLRTEGITVDLLGDILEG